MGWFIFEIIVSIAMLGWGAHDLYEGLASGQASLIAWAAFKLGVGLVNGFIAAALLLARELEKLKEGGW